MGAKPSKKYEPRPKNLNQFASFLHKVCDSQELLATTLVSLPKLDQTWREHLSADHLKLLMNFFSKQQLLTVVKLTEFYDNLVDGSPDDKMAVLFTLLESDKHFKLHDVGHYVESVVKSSIGILRKTDAYKIWASVSMNNDFSSEKSLSNYILKDLCCESGQIEESEVASWLYRTSIFSELSDHVYKTLYLVQPSLELKLPTLLLSKSGGESILSAGELIFFTILLQRDFAEKWRLLFSTKTCGQSWATLCKCITAQGPTLVIIKSDNDSVLGGFAANSWGFHPDFFGNDYSFIFQLRPSIQIFEATNYNKNFQYFNSGQATLPNGLGMGGQFGYWGFFISSDFGKCKTSETCTTFKRYKFENVAKEFGIKDLEVWGVSKPDPTAAELGERVGTCLENDPTANAIFELAGKTAYSTDIRAQKPIDEDQPSDKC